MSETSAQSQDSAPHPLRCSSMTKQGKECKGYAVNGGTTCVAHTPGLKERSLAAATQASAEARTSAVAARKEADDDAKLTLTQRLRRDAARDAADLVSSLLLAAKADGNGAAMREVWNRIEGKVTDSLSVNAGDPFQMSEADLHRWLSEASTEPAEAPKESL